MLYLYLATRIRWVYIPIILLALVCMKSVLKRFHTVNVVFAVVCGLHLLGFLIATEVCGVPIYKTWVHIDFMLTVILMISVSIMCGPVSAIGTTLITFLTVMLIYFIGVIVTELWVASIILVIAIFLAIFSSLKGR